jgi:hypothetical protein
MKQNPVRKSQGENRIVGLQMTPAETRTFFKTLGRKVVTFFGYSVDYEHEAVMLAKARDVLSRYSPQTYVINIGGTAGGIGAVYPLAKAMGFKTTGIVSSVAAEHMEYISKDVDHICFVADTQWGGKLPGTNELSPTSQAMVACSDILVAIGGGEVSRDELLEGRRQGKPIFFYPAEISHEYWTERARKMGMPKPNSFWGAVHEIFGDSRSK